MPRRVRLGTRRVSAAAVVDPHTPGPLPGTGTSLRHQGSHRGRKSRAILLLDSKFPI